MGWCPLGTQGLPASGHVVSLSSWVWVSKASNQHIHLGGYWVITPCLCARSDQTPREEAPGVQVPGLVLSPVPVAWLALVQGHLGLGVSGLPSSHILGLGPHQVRTRMGSLASPALRTSGQPSLRGFKKSTDILRDMVWCQSQAVVGLDDLKGHFQSK